MTWKAINAFCPIRIGLALAAGLLVATSVMAAGEETPPWQQPQGCQSGNGCQSGDCADGACDESPDCSCLPWPSFMPQDDWVRMEALLWWTKGASTPPLLTTGPAGTNAGELGQTGTSILFGGEEVNAGFRPGGRISFGTWLDCQDSVGVEASYLTLGQSVQNYDATSTGSPILTRPFFNVGPVTSTNPNPGSQDVLYLANTSSGQSGTFSASSTSNFQVAEVLVRKAIGRACDYRVEFLAGYRYQQLTDGLDITSSTTAADQTISTFDEFHTRNYFNGAVIGVAGEVRRCRWTLESSLKLGVGDTHSEIDITGNTTTPAGTFPGGFLALASNSNSYSHDQFSTVPELGLTLAYDLTPHLRATVGYSLIYWSVVARPGDQIDLNISPSQFVPPTGNNGKPEFALQTTDYWAQGINVGLDYRF